MTLLVSWTGVDTHGTASAYIVADSRISWSNLAKFDHGRKVFAFRRSPDILGYCGDVVFPTIVLSQIIEMADRGLLFSATSSCKERFEAINEKLAQQFKRYPRMVKEIPDTTLQVLHISRDQTDNYKFACWMIEWNLINGWRGRNIALPTSSDVLFSLGSGANEFNKNFKDRYEKGPDKGTSRCVFHCFCDTLLNIKDKKCGGAPQLVGLYRKPNSPGIAYGVIQNKRRTFLGAPINKNVDLKGVEWRNDLFERCDGYTMKKLESAQSQPDYLRRN